MDMVSFFNRAIGPLKRRVMTMISRAVVKAVNDAGGIQKLKLQIRSDEVLEDVERFQQAGFSSHPNNNSEVVVVFVGGNAEHPIAVCLDDRTVRPKNLAQGDVVLYNIKDGILKITAKAGGKVTVNNAANEMVSVVSAFMQKVIDGKFITGIGPQPWVPSDKAALEAEKTKFDTFKE